MIYFFIAAVGRVFTTMSKKGLLLCCLGQHYKLAFARNNLSAYVSIAYAANQNSLFGRATTSLCLTTPVLRRGRRVKRSKRSHLSKITSLTETTVGIIV